MTHSTQRFKTEVQNRGSKQRFKTEVQNRGSKQRFKREGFGIGCAVFFVHGEKLSGIGGLATRV
jgi:hypothetical protein